jgi:hypothetical protein
VDAVLDGVTGRRLDDRRDALALTAALRSLLPGATTRVAVVAAARDRVASRYSWDRIAAETSRVYECALPTRVEAIPPPRTARSPGPASRRPPEVGRPTA